MQQLERTRENVAKNVLRNNVALGILFGKAALGQFNVERCVRYRYDIYNRSQVFFKCFVIGFLQVLCN